jgi:hypothetical protein
MAYYIFLKSLRSLEEFRKNLHVKIPPKSPPTNFQSLAIIKNQNFIQKTIFLHFRPRMAQRPVGPSGLSAQPPSPAPPPPAGRAHALGPSRPAWPWRNCEKPPLLRVCVAQRLRLLPLSPPCGPHLSASLSPPRHRSWLKSPPRLSASIIATPIKDPYSSALIPLLESLLTPSPTINGVGRKSPAVTHRHFLPGAPTTPIKGEQPLQASPHLSPLSFPSLRALTSLSLSADTTEPSLSSPVLLDTTRAPVRP